MRQVVIICSSSWCSYLVWLIVNFEIYSFFFLLVAITQWNFHFLAQLNYVFYKFLLQLVKVWLKFALIHIKFIKVFHHINFMLKSSQYSLCSGLLSVMSAVIVYHSISWLNMFSVWFYESLISTTHESKLQILEKFNLAMSKLNEGILFIVLYLYWNVVIASWHNCFELRTLFIGCSVLFDRRLFRFVAH